ncbi:MAG TPA: hypothetical protein VI749_05440 [Candidatus Omnitrophota bacterium]|nr:hypothetical protein [Candidatus Omnitrophota bacterium]
MEVLSRRKRSKPGFRFLSCLTVLCFSCHLVLTPYLSSAQTVGSSALQLPTPGTLLTQSPIFTPPLIKAITVNSDDALKFDFIIDTGDVNIDGDALKEEADKLVKYFLAALTVPSEELWVNLSPYEEDRIIPRNLGYTEMGRDLLAQDYILKQLTASLMYPENQLGKEFWQKVQSKANELYGASDIPMNTFNKIWIVPDQAVVLERGNNAIVLDSHLKVMLEEDYLGLKENMDNKKFGTDRMQEDDVKKINAIASNVVREVIVPEIEKEVNEGENFANLRQIYNAMILATWYKQNLKESFLSQVYVDKNKIEGVDTQDRAVKEKIFDKYLETFQQGAYEYTTKEFDLETFSLVPKRYYSGGFAGDRAAQVVRAGTTQVSAEVPLAQAGLDEAMMTSVNRLLERATTNPERVARVSFALGNREPNAAQDMGITLPNMAAVLRTNAPSFNAELGRSLGQQGVPQEEISLVVGIVGDTLRRAPRSTTQEIMSVLSSRGISQQTLPTVEKSLPSLAQTVFERSTPQPVLVDVASGIAANQQLAGNAYSASVANRLIGEGEIEPAQARSVAATTAQVITRLRTQSPEAFSTPIQYEAAITAGLEREGIDRPTAVTAARIASDLDTMREVADQTQGRYQFNMQISVMPVLYAVNQPRMQSIVTSALQTDNFNEDEIAAVTPVMQNLREYGSLDQLEQKITEGLRIAQPQMPEDSVRNLASRVATKEVIDRINNLAGQAEEFKGVDSHLASSSTRFALVGDQRTNVINVAEALNRTTPLNPSEAQPAAQALVNVLAKPELLGDRDGLRSTYLTELRSLNVAEPLAQRMAGIVIDNSEGLSGRIYQAVAESSSAGDRMSYNPTLARVVVEAAMGQAFEDDYRDSLRAPEVSQFGLRFTSEEIQALPGQVAQLAERNPAALRSLSEFQAGLREVGAAPETAEKASNAFVVRQFGEVSSARQQSDTLLRLMPQNIANPQVFQDVFRPMAEQVMSASGIQSIDFEPIVTAFGDLARNNPQAFDGGEERLLSVLQQRPNISADSLARIREQRLISNMAQVIGRGMAQLDTGNRDSRGGIDLNMAMLNLVVQREGNGVQMTIAASTIENLNLGGFEPVITRVERDLNMQQELGLDR